MTSTTKIRKRLLQQRRYDDHYRARKTGTGQRGVYRTLALRRTLRRRKIQGRIHTAIRRLQAAMPGVVVAFARATDAFHLLTQSAQRWNPTPKGVTP